MNWGRVMIRPYLAAGFFYGMLTGAIGSAQSSTVQYINDVAINLENNDIGRRYFRQLYHHTTGNFSRQSDCLLNMSRIVLFAEADYYISLHNIVNESARYSNQQSVGSSYNVPDNLKLDNLVINIGVLFRINSSLGNQGGGRGKGSAVECPHY